MQASFADHVKAERDLHGFIFLNRRILFPNGYPPLRMCISTYGNPHTGPPIERVDIAAMGYILASRWAVEIHGDLQIPELCPCFGWRPMGKFGARFLELGFYCSTTKRIIRELVRFLIRLAFSASQ